MKRNIIALLLTCLSFCARAQTEEFEFNFDSIEQSFKYEYGIIQLKNGIGQMTIPKGFKYLDAAQSEKVLVDLWGNPKSENISLGMILPENQGIMSDNSYVFNIQYDEIGYVEDDDADDIDYDDLLKQMQQEADEANKMRTLKGYEPIEVIGWAAEPFYDSEKKILRWAKEIKFGTNADHTLNYNVRVLGRKGVIVLNAIASMPNLEIVKQDVPKVLDIVQFNEGFKYSDFDASVDQVAAWTIGGLVAGKVLAKFGFFALIVKFWKLIVVAIIGAGGTLWKRFRNKKEEEELQARENLATAEPKDENHS